MDKVDRRVLKTKKAIRNALAELLSEKDIGEITVKDLADLADINRKTFYNYYSGVHQVIDEIENEIVSVFEETLEDIDFKVGTQDPYYIFGKLTHIINSDLDFYSQLMKINQNASLLSKITCALKDRIKISFAKQYSIESHKLNIMVNYAVAGMLSVYQEWFNSDRTQSVEEISREISILAFRGVSGILEEIK